MLQGVRDLREQKEASKEPELFISLVHVSRVEVKKPSTQLRPASKDMGDCAHCSSEPSGLPEKRESDMIVVARPVWLRG